MPRPRKSRRTRNCWTPSAPERKADSGALGYGRAPDAISAERLSFAARRLAARYLAGGIFFQASVVAQHLRAALLQRLAGVAQHEVDERGRHVQHGGNVPLRVARQVIELERGACPLRQQI